MARKKKDKRTVFILIGVALATFGIGYLIIKWGDIFPSRPKPGAKPPSDKDCVNPSFIGANDNLPLIFGSKGTKVEQLQRYLLQRGSDLGAGGADGKFGCYTLKALRQYESKEQIDSNMYDNLIKSF